MKKYLLLLILLVSGIIVFAQSNAPNFTATDCSGKSHILYDELAAGKIVVIVWVMPCSYCISDALSAYDAVQSFASTNPNVVYYLADDFGNASCSSLAGWASTNGIPEKNITIFQNVGTPLNENQYGGSGMPHVVVIGGADHKIYLNIKNSSNNKAVIQNAITEALSSVTSTNELNSNISNIAITPNLIKDKLHLQYFLNKASEVKITITDMAGFEIKSIRSKRDSGNNDVDIDVNVPDGVYLLQLKSGEQNKILKFTVSH